jgi:hypothetical protein
MREDSGAGDQNQSQRPAGGTGSARAVQNEPKNTLQINAPAQSKTQSRILGLLTSSPDLVILTKLEAL